jgi:hypothetical protein
LGIERNNRIHLALDIPLEVEYEVICDHLRALEKRDILHFETCEVRIPGTVNQLMMINIVRGERLVAPDASCTSCVSSVIRFANG